MTEAIPKPPPDLKREGRRFWKKINAELKLEDAHRFELLAGACGCLDRIREAQDDIKARGAYPLDRFGQLRPHPGLKVEKDNKTLFVRTIRELGLDLAVPESEFKRPPKRY